ncbi:MAG: hypothetical protein M3441_08625 [Chloroflexota bacterium]|nr:hypothetical protein [Chloroflexota bacterium]
MQLRGAIEQLDREWELETGFFGLLRSGTFDQERADKVISILQVLASDVSQDSTADALDRRLVELTWFIPLFMSWQRGRIEQLGGDLRGFDDTVDAVVSLLQRILGVP